MLLKPNKKLEEHIKNTFEKGFKNSYLSASIIKDSEVMFLKLKKTPILYIYGWGSEKDFWILSEN